MKHRCVRKKDGTNIPSFGDHLIGADMHRTHGLSRRTRLWILGAVVGALALSAALFSGRSRSGPEAAAPNASFAAAIPSAPGARPAAAPSRTSAAAPARAHGPVLTLLRKGRSFDGD